MSATFSTIQYSEIIILAYKQHLILSQTPPIVIPVQYMRFNINASFAELRT